MSGVTDCTVNTDPARADNSERLEQMAKPMPTLPPLGAMIALLIPTSSPLDQQSSGVAWVDGRISLNEVFVFVGDNSAAAKRSPSAFCRVEAACSRA